MSLILTKGVLTGTTFSETQATWFFENPYWNNDGHQDFVIQVHNNGSSTESLGGFTFTFQIADSKGQSFPSSSGQSHVAAGNNCTMTISISTSAGTYSGSSYIEKDPRLLFHKSDEWGMSYWTPRPGPGYTFRFNEAVPIKAGETQYVRFKADFDGGNGDTNCIQISSADTVTALPNYTVTWKLNGGSYASSTNDVVQTVVQGGRASQPSGVTRSGYDFSGWSPNDENWTNVRTNLTYTAQWTPSTTKYSFWRNHDDNDDTPLKQGTAPIGTPISDAKPKNDPSWSGYTFMGWSTERSGQVISDKTQITAAVCNFYAQWSIVTGIVQFNRNYDANDTEIIHTAENVEYITETLGIVKPENDPKRYGYEFLGWALNRDTGQLVDETRLWDPIADKPRTMFYAKWKRIRSIWVVREVTEDGVTHKKWVKEINAYKVVEDAQHNKSWEPIYPKVMDKDAQHDKSWRDKY